MTGDDVAGFLRANTVTAADIVPNVREFHRAFCAWSRTRPGLGEFLPALVAAGVDVEPVGGEAWAHGVRLTDEGLATLFG